MTKISAQKGITALLVFTITCVVATAAPQSKTDFPESYTTSATGTSSIQSAWYDDATTRYAHGVLGDAIEAASLHAETNEGQLLSITLETTHVFEDIQPRLADLDGDGNDEIITIRSHNQKGGQIAVYGVTKTTPNTLSLVASTPYIGQAYRWLAPIGIADFNNDGEMDIAYIDRPHLAQTLRVWSYRDGHLQQVAQTQGLTNHKIGHDYITGGVRYCGEDIAMVTVNSNWTRLIKTTFINGKLISQDIGPYSGTTSADTALSCH